MSVSFVISVPSSQGNVDGIERQRPVTSTRIRKAWETVATLVKKKCSAPLVKKICSQTFVFFVVTLLIIPILIIPMILVTLPLYLLFLPLYLLAQLVYTLLKWKGIFILSCVAVSVDTLFLYIPIIDEKNKCLGMDKTLRNVALVFRSLTDFAFIFHIINLIYGVMDHGPKWDDANSDSDVPAAASWLERKLELVREAIAEKMPWLSISIIINCLAILPIPQVREYFS